MTPNNSNTENNNQEQPVRVRIVNTGDWFAKGDELNVIDEGDCYMTLTPFSRMIVKSDCEVIPEPENDEHYHIPLKNHEGHATFTGEASKELIDAKKRMAELKKANPNEKYRLIKTSY